MYGNLEVLSAMQHGDVRLTPASNWLYAQGLSHVPAARDEIDTLTVDYVIVFSQSAPVRPIVLLGGDGTNRYVTAAGAWLSTRIPALLRFYPFALVPGERPGTYAVARDADAPHFAEQKNGQALFAEDGKPSDLLQQVTERLTHWHRSVMEAEALTGQLVEAGLLDERRIDAHLTDGDVHHFTGFKAVVEEKLATLDEATRARLAESGALALLEAHRRSLANFSRLLPAMPPPAATE